MVIVTWESTSSVGFPSRRPVGVDKFVNCIAWVRPFLLRAGVLLKVFSENSLLFPGTFQWAPKAQLLPHFWHRRLLLVWRSCWRGQGVWGPTCRLWELDPPGCPSGCLSWSASCFLPEGSLYHWPQLAPTHLRPAASILWLGPQRVSPGPRAVVSVLLCDLGQVIRFLWLSVWSSEDEKFGQDALQSPYPPCSSPGEGGAACVLRLEGRLGKAVVHVCEHSGTIHWKNTDLKCWKERMISGSIYNLRYRLRRKGPFTWQCRGALLLK